MKSSMPITDRLGSALTFLVSVVGLCLVTAYAQQAPAAAQKPTTGTGPVNLTAKSANVSEPGIPVRINIFGWSTDEELNSVVAAMNPPAPAASPAGAAAGDRGGRGGRGGGARGGRGAAANADAVADPADPDNPDNPDALPARGAGRGGRGAARGGPGNAAKPFDPISSLTAAIGKAPTVGYIWTNEVAGYSIKYAYHAPTRDGGERIILATDRRLGGYTTAWKSAAAATPTAYEFTLIEIRMDPKGLGEGKTSLVTKVIVDSETKTLALDNYASSAAMLQNVKR